MANAKKCDRCGKYYEKNETKPRIITDACFVSGLKTLANIPNATFNDEHFDLCDECLEEFYRFMDGQ